MKGRGVVSAILLGAGAIAGGFYLLGMQFSGGTAYPEYSSLRSDPPGAKLLFDTLTLVPGTSVTRNYLPLEYIPGSGASVILLALKPEALEADQLARLDKLAAHGNRVVMAMAEVSEPPANAGALARVWKVRLGLEVPSADESHLFFTESSGWKTIRQAGIKPVVIERAMGKGSVVIFAESQPFGNVGLADTATSDFALISTAIGSSSRVVFDEEHFGITQTGSVVGLVRRFRLTGMAMGFAICAALFIWRNVTAFPPPAVGVADKTAREAAGISGRTSHSGLLTLLRRHVPLSELASVCLSEWLAVNRRGLSTENAAHAQDVIRNAGGEPIKALREIQSLFHSKGTP